MIDASSGAPIVRRWRSALFTPATTPDRAAKLPDLGCDLGIIDLEDAVAESAKAAARAQARSVSAEIASKAPLFALFVRVNPVASVHFRDDLAGGLVPDLAGIVLPKVEQASQLDEADDLLSSLGLGHLLVVAGIETGRGVLEARAITSHPRVAAVYFGAEDLAADIGGERSRKGLEVLYARSKVALTASVAGIESLDGIVADYSDDDRFREEGALARALSYSGKMCIHPRQVPLANEAFTPSAEQIAYARRVVDAYRAAEEKGQGAISIDGSMIDEPMARRAHSVLSAAGEDA
jgi:citrate lyase subunit beta / citryl-CoA lyase